jgi:hypothetical protein
VGLTSLYYWLTLALLVAIESWAIKVVSHDEEANRLYPLAFALCVLPWLALATIMAGPLFYGSLNADPRWPPLWSGLPAALDLGVVVVLVGPYLVAGLFGARHDVLHPVRLWRKWKTRTRKVKPSITPAELQAAEDFDDKWQVEDRERNKRLGLGPRL